VKRSNPKEIAAPPSEARNDIKRARTARKDAFLSFPFLVITRSGEPLAASEVWPDKAISLEQ